MQASLILTRLDFEKSLEELLLLLFVDDPKLLLLTALLLIFVFENELFRFKGVDRFDEEGSGGSD